ncbi:MAG: flagellar biosynthesis protein FlhB, partial [Paracoccaceae bacterium]
LSVAAAYLGLILAFLLFGEQIANQAGAALSAALGRADEISQVVFMPGGGTRLFQAGLEIMIGLLPVYFLPALAVFGVIIAQRALVFAPQKLAPRLSRISLLAVAKNKFGPAGLFEFAKSLVKLVVISTAAAVFLYQGRERLLGSIAADPRAVPGLAIETLRGFLWIVFFMTLTISFVDYLWQYRVHRQKLMMSRQEVTDENKESEGDPHLKQKRRKRGMDIAAQRMIADVPDADVVIVNPEHFAVALKWDRMNESAPVCTAKGVDEMAARIRETAIEAGVPLHRDPPTARAIYAIVQIGEEIHPDHYRQVAAAVRYADRIRKLARK